MDLCCLGGLRGLCGFCVREWLGGYMTCGVFAFVFLLLSLCLLSFYARCPSLLWLSFFVLFACFVCPCGLVVFVVVSFSLTDYTQKERARRVGASSLRVLCVFRFL